MEKQINRRHAHYNNAVKPALKEKFGYANVMEIPRLDKIVLSLRLGKEKDNSKKIERPSIYFLFVDCSRCMDRKYDFVECFFFVFLRHNI